MPLFTPRPSPIRYDRLAIDHEYLFGQDDPAHQAILEPVSNAYMSAALYSQRIIPDRFIRFGRVVYAMPGLHWYRVQLGDGDSDLPCCKLSNSGGLAPLGMREIGAIPPGAGVYVYKPPQALYGYILGTVPEVVYDGSLAFPDWIVQGGQTGFKREGYYRELFRLVGDDPVIDFGAGRPMDGTAVGEWGHLNELGGGVFFDPFLGFFRIDEETGLFLHYHDQYLLLTGHNLDIRGAGSEWLCRDDEGEVRLYQGEALYPWEALGALSPSVGNLAKSVSADDVQYNQPYGALEPTQPLQTPFHRRRSWGGYLGQGGKRTLAAPRAIPATGGGTGLNTYQSGPEPGLFEENLAADGSYFLRSAKQVLLAKRLVIPVPKQLKLPEDGTGDDARAGNYKFSGWYGTAAPHKVGDPTLGGVDNLQLRLAAGVMDLHAHLFNWKGLHPFHYHKQDYQLAEESASPAFTSNQAVPPFADLGYGKPLLDPPPAQQIPIDHRYGNVNYYATNSYFHMLEDGGVVIGDGYGSEIRLTGGNIYLHCPGNVYLQPGMSAITMAGDDVVLRAKKSLDASAGIGDLRLKADRNMQLLAGNNGTGGILLESKASGPAYQFDGLTGEDVVSSGIMLRCPNSQLVGWSRDIYLRSLLVGSIILDADAGQGGIKTISNDFERFMESSARDVWGVQQQRAVSTFSDNNALLCSALSVNGVLTVANADGDSGIICQGQLDIIDGHIATDEARAFNGLVGYLEDQALEEVAASVAQVEGELSQELSTGQLLYQNFVSLFYQTGQPGSQDLIENAAFSFRTELQYNTPQFVLPEARWQQMARLAGAGLTTWHEPAVQYQSESLGPYPGYQAWQTQDSYQQMQLVLYNHATGLAVDRGGGVYENPVLGAWKSVPADGNYVTIL